MSTLSAKGAHLSRCRHYRYRLWRHWQPGAPVLTFVGLNPSTADATVDDPTLRRCMGFAQRDGFGGVEVVNLFALRATNPSELKRVHDPVGPRNDEILRRTFRHAHTIVLSWGAGGGLLGRDQAVLSMLEHLPSEVDVMCLGRTQQGHPRHPLYIRKTAPLLAWFT